MRSKADVFLQFTISYQKLSALPRRVRRLLQRKWGRSLASVALLLVLGQTPVRAATITVDGTTCTLVDAITAANTDTATGGCTTGNGADSLVLPGGSTHTLTAVHNNEFGPTGLPVISSPITIEGNGSTITRDSAAPPFRILALDKRGNLTLKATTISGGQAPGRPDPGFIEYAYGGGIANFFGTLTLEGCTVTGNTARTQGGGVHSRADGSDAVTLNNSTVSGNSAFNGGGVWLLTYGSSQVTFTHSTVSGNSAERGGGVWIITYGGSQVAFTHSTISGNSTSSFGGGVFSSTDSSSQVILTDTTVSGNANGGVYNFTYGSSQVTLTNTIVSSNAGAGVFNFTYGSSRVALRNTIVSGNTGGGVESGTYDRSQVTLSNTTVSGNGDGGVFSNANGRSQVTLSNTTVSGNSASFGGGVTSVASYSGRVILSNTTISGNTASVYGGGGMFSLIYDSGQIVLSRTLIAGNTASSGAEVFHINRSGTLTADSFNLFGHSDLTNAQAFAGFSPGPTDLTATSDGMTPTVLSAILDTTLQNNGGPTQTHNLVSGSPAIDAAGTKCEVSIDQRGFARLVDGNGDTVASCDIGALEFDSSSTPCATALPTLDCTVNGVPHQVCIGTAGNDTIIGTAGSDVIVGLSGNDVLRG